VFKFLMMNAAEGVAEDAAVTEKTLDDVYAILQEVSADLSGLNNRISSLEASVSEFQSLVLDKFDLMHKMLSDKLDMIEKTLEQMPQYSQMQYITAFLFMLVCFEFMRLVRGWTSYGKKKRGGKYWNL